MAQEPQTAQERARQLLRATLATSKWVPTTEEQRLVWAIRIAVVLGVLAAIGYAFEKTLWDWLNLLIVPAVIAAGVAWLNRRQREREQQLADQQRERERQLADQRAQDVALQAYLDQMSQLLTDTDRSLGHAKEDAEVRTLARARTLTVLARLDGSRKWSVLMFLQEAGLIRIEDDPVVSLKWANLQDADLGEVVLEGADLHETKLQRAYLYAAKLQGARLVRADLSGADLSDARGWTEEQLTAAETLEGATMPDGQILKNRLDPDGPTFAEWIKEWIESKIREEDGENSSPS